MKIKLLTYTEFNRLYRNSEICKVIYTNNLAFNMKRILHNNNESWCDVSKILEVKLNNKIILIGIIDNCKYNGYLVSTRSKLISKKHR